MSVAIAKSENRSQKTSGSDAPKITFWGVRGSLPSPGPDTVAFGGNTTCLEVEAGDADRRRRFIIDAGSGIRSLGASGNWSGVHRVDLLLTHLHHDHVIGLPFFKLLHDPAIEVHIWCGNLEGRSADADLMRMFSPPLFPLTLHQLPANLSFHGFNAGDVLSFDDVRVRTALLHHPSGATGYRFDGVDGSLAIVTDIEHVGNTPDPDVVALCKGVDTLVYDSMLEETDFRRCKGWGHSTASAAVAVGRAAGVRRIVGCHHAPEQTDAIMLERERRLRADWPDSLMAREGISLVCAPRA